jgi:hypothetical protein
MADTLFDALSGLNMSGAENPYGVAAMSLGQVTPQLITPYTSTGRAVGIGLGSVLLQSLLGYQARQQAARETLELNTLANQMMTMTTPQARTELIGGLEDPMQQSRLSTLSTALMQQDLATKQLAKQQAALAEAELPTKALLAGLQSGLVSPEEFQQQFLSKSNKTITDESAPTAAEKFIDIVSTIPEAKLPETQIETIAAKAPPAVEQLTAEDAVQLSPKAYQQKQDRIMRQQRDLELWTQNRRFEAEQTKDQKRIMREAGKELADTATAKEYERVGTILQTAENIASKAEPSIGDIQKLIAMAQKTIDASQVTLGEQELYGKVDPLITRWETKIKSNLTGSPQISKKAINDTVDFIRNIYGVLGQKYNTTAENIAKQYEVPTADAIMRAPKYQDPNAAKVETLRQLREELAQLKAARGIK